MPLGSVDDFEAAFDRLRRVLPADGVRAPLPVDRSRSRTVLECLTRLKQPQVELVLLTTVLIGLPATDLDERRAPPESGAGLGQRPADQFHPRIVRFRNWKWFPPNAAIVLPVVHDDG